MAKQKTEESVNVQYGGYLTAAQKNEDGANYTYNWDKVTDKADLKKRQLPPEKFETDAAPAATSI